jgi:hypothetical protein
VPAASPSEGELFKRILGVRWSDLHADIRHRFDKNPELGKPLLYTGVLSELTCSPAGKVWACLARPFINGALIPHTDANFPVDIEVYSRRGDPAIYKQRIYHLNGRKPVQFTSFMRESRRGEVLEYVGSGLGMTLLLDVRDGNLHFESAGYFWQLGGVRIRIPALLTPGKTYLCHRNCDSTSFAIRIRIEHPVFGTTFTQAGSFRELGA